MTTTSLIAESMRYQETLSDTRERMSTNNHVAHNYRAIALPAVAAAARKVAARRREARAAASEIALRLSDATV